MKPSDYIKKGWCQHVMSKTEEGDPCNPDNPIAARWCPWGAAHAAYGADTKAESRFRWTANNILRRRGVRPCHMPNWNDAEGRTRDEVIAVVEEIEATLEQEYPGS